MRILGWPRWRVIRWMKRTGSGSLEHGRWFTTLEALRERFPMAALAVASAIDEKGRKASEAAARTVENRLTLLTSKQASSEARIRTLEQTVRENRSEIRKLRRRLRRKRVLDQPP